MITLWNIFIYNPIYNILIFVAQHLTFKDVGLAVIVFTIIIRLALFPVSKKSVVGQYKMKLLEPKIKAIKAKGLSKEAEAQETFALYSQEKINPFSGCLYLLIQLPILIAINLVFHRGLTQPYHLYNFLNTTGLNNIFLGHDLAQPLLLFAILAGITQAVQAFIIPQPDMSTSDSASMQNQFAKSLSLQTKYILPLIIIYIATKFSAALSLYWTVANLFSIGQELYLRKTVRSKMGKQLLAE